MNQLGLGTCALFNGCIQLLYPHGPIEEKRKSSVGGGGGGGG